MGLRISFLIYFFIFFLSNVSFGKSCDYFLENKMVPELKTQKYMKTGGYLIEDLISDYTSIRKIIEDVQTENIEVASAMVLRTHLLTGLELPDIIDLFHETETLFSLSHIQHYVMVQTSLLTDTPMKELIELTSSVKTEFSAQKVPLQFIIQTALITNTPLEDVAKYFKNYPRTPWQKTSLINCIVIQTNFLNQELLPADVIKKFRTPTPFNADQARLIKAWPVLLQLSFASRR